MILLCTYVILFFKYENTSMKISPSLAFISIVSKCWSRISTLILTERAPETEGEGRPGEPTVDVRHREQLLQLLPRLPVARGQGGAH